MLERPSLLMTADELWNLPHEQQKMCELVRGELRMMTPAGARHGDIVNNLAYELTSFVKRGRLGKVFSADTGYRIASDPDTVVAPDVSFVRREEIPAEGLPVRFWNQAPTLAAEVISPSDTAPAVRQRAQMLLEAGTLVVWIVEPDSKSIEVHRLGQSVVKIEVRDRLSEDDVLPGFSCRVAELFGG
ncbi:MAG: Uma2 family endonuclease [Pirellulales bacterium]|nr:Uma2 family endonuclease [Pirellulales bacterium]